MIAVLGYASLIEYEDLVRVLDGAQSMGDHDTRPAFGDTFCGLLDQLLAHTVHTAGGLVKNKDTRVVHTGTDEGDELPLPHTKNAPSFASLDISSSDTIYLLCFSRYLYEQTVVSKHQHFTNDNNQHQLS